MFSKLVIVILFIAFLVALPHTTHGQESAQPSLPGYDEQLDAFFKAIEAGEFKKAIEDLYQPNPWRDSIRDKLSALKGQFVSLPDLVGELHGYDLITHEQFADRFVYCWYVVAFDRQPLGFHFTFYKPQETWFVFSFEYKDDIKALAEELARMKLLYADGTAEGKETRILQSASVAKDL